MMPALKIWRVLQVMFKLTLFNSPIFNSLVYWFIRPKICGRKAAMVSVVQLGGMQLATSSPSCKAIREPVTPGKWQVLLTISFGVQWRFSGSPNISARFCGAFRGAPAAAGAGQAGAGWAGAGCTGAGCTDAGWGRAG